jgi:hypothetical protein
LSASSIIKYHPAKYSYYSLLAFCGIAFQKGYYHFHVPSGGLRLNVSGGNCENEYDPLLFLFKLGNLLSAISLSLA